METIETSLPELINSCRVLFGEGVDITPDFLHILEPSGLKSAYRRRLLETHPDRAIHLRISPTLLEERCKEVNVAYERLSLYLNKHTGSGTVEKQPPPHHVYPWERYNRPGYKDKAPRGNNIFRGRLPQTKLKFGSYLYYSGIITMVSLIDAIVWQKRQRPLLGAMALERGWIAKGDILHILKARRPGERFGESALRCGRLDRGQISHLLRLQKLLQPRIGQYFVKQGFFSHNELERLLKEMFLHNLRCRRP